MKRTPTGTVKRRGFALMTVLWVMLAVAVMALGGATTTRDGIALSAYRVEAERAHWLARACFEIARGAADAALADARRDESVLRVWRELDRHVRIARPECEVTVEAVGSRLDVNAADGSQLREVFDYLRLANAGSLTSAILEHRGNHGAIADLGQLKLNGGLAREIPTDAPIGVEPGRVSLNNAPLAVLAAVPGFSDDVLARIGTERDNGRQIDEVLALANLLPPPARDSIMAHFPEVVRLTTVNPDAWIVRAEAWSGEPRATAVVEGRIVLDGTSTAVIRVRAW